MVTQLHKFSKNHWIIHLKYVNFFVCKLYLMKAVKIWLFMTSRIRTKIPNMTYSPSIFPASPCLISPPSLHLVLHFIPQLLQTPFCTELKHHPDCSS